MAKCLKPKAAASSTTGIPQVIGVAARRQEFEDPEA